MLGGRAGADHARDRRAPRADRDAEREDPRRPRKHHQAHGPPRGRDRSGLPRVVCVMASEGSEEARRTEAFAWVLVMGLGALGLAAGLTLAPALGELFEPTPLETWPDDAVRALISPEPTELARFAI